MSKHNCIHCNRELSNVKVHFFGPDGRETYILIPLSKGDKEQAAHFDISKDATMFEFVDFDGGDDTTDFKDNIICPYCNKYPFKSLPHIYEYATLVFEDEED